MQDTSYFLGKVRRAANASGRFQVFTDGRGAYKHGAPFNLGFGQLIKTYASNGSWPSPCSHETRGIARVMIQRERGVECVVLHC